MAADSGPDRSQSGATSGPDAGQSRRPSREVFHLFNSGMWFIIKLTIFHLENQCLFISCENVFTFTGEHQRNTHLKHICVAM